MNMDASNASNAADPVEAWSAYYGAPASLQVLGAFLNSTDERTFGDHQPRDELTDRRALSGWLVARGLVAAGTSVNDVEFADALRLRAALREAAAANQRAPRPPQAAGRREADLGEAADRLALRVRVGTGGVVLEPAGGGRAARALAGLAALAVVATADGTWQRVKMCAAPDCRVVFYDGSKPRTGRWCATAVCGNRAKTRRYRQRLSQSGAVPGADAPPPPPPG